MRACVRACLLVCMCVFLSRVETKDNLFCQYINLIFLKSCHTWGQWDYNWESGTMLYIWISVFSLV